MRLLENLVKQLRGELERANAAVAQSATGGSAVLSPEGSSDHRINQKSSSRQMEGDVLAQLGRMVLQDQDRSRYVSSGFWSCVDDEVYRNSLLYGGLGDFHAEPILCS